MEFAYNCPACGNFESEIALDSVMCRCGKAAKRRFLIAINKTSLKHTGRWDPVVGEYVRNDREFKTLLGQGQDAQAQKLNMDVKLATCDPRDKDAMSELHGWSKEARVADVERSAKAPT